MSGGVRECQCHGDISADNTNRSVRGTVPLTTLIDFDLQIRKANDYIIPITRLDDTKIVNRAENCI
jgi:hypothetical protein